MCVENVAMGNLKEQLKTVNDIREQQITSQGC